MTFFTLLNNSSGLIVYVHATKNSELIHQINYYLHDKKTKNELSLIYSSDEGQFHFDNKVINFYYSQVNFESALLAHNQLKDRFAFKFNLRQKFISLYEKISLSADQVNNKLLTLNKKLNVTNLNNAIQRCKNENFVSYSKLSNNNVDLTPLVEFINSNINWSCEFNFKEFFNIYSIPKHHRLVDRACYKTVVFENVYYRNKGFYKKDGTFFDIKEISQDIEYKDYNKLPLKLDTENAIQVTEPVLFLDYIYDFYNFGEFWDIVKRLIFFDNQEKVEIFGLSQNRILNIKNYFSKFELTYPPKYCRDYKHTDVFTETNKGSTIFFSKVLFSVIQNTARSTVDPWFAFEINNKFNASTLSNKKYNVYLSRGSMKRGVLNEEKLLNTLLQNFNFIVLDGSESLEEQQYYFTNANLIIGAHGSLMCNTIWCLSNPIFIELTPPLRCVQLSFFDDTSSIGIKSIIIPCDADEEERVIISDDNVNHLCELIRLVI